MAIYLILAAIPIVFSLPFKDLDKNKRSKKKFLIAVGIILFLFMGLRSQYVGSGDSYNYYNMMKKAINSSSWTDYYYPDGVEGGFQFFTYCLSRLFSNPQMIIVVSSGIYVFSICFFIFRNSKDVTFSVVMYITLDLMRFQMQGMRQAIAMSICIFAYEFVKNKKIIPFTLLFLLAMQFHRTAVVFVVVLFLIYLPYNWKSISVISLFAAVFLLFADNVVSIANVVFDSNYGQAVDHGGFVVVAIYIIITVLAILLDAKLKTDKKESSLFFITLLGLLCYIMRYIGALASERISFYFMFGQVALLPNAIAYFNDRDKRIVKLIAYILMIALFAYRLNGSDMVPFEFCWND